jgi:uncharacterized protein YfaA (DUF2138 family)
VISEIIKMISSAASCCWISSGVSIKPILMGLLSSPKGGSVGVDVGLRVGSRVGVMDSRAMGVVDAVGVGVKVGVVGAQEDSIHTKTISRMEIYLDGG